MSALISSRAPAPGLANRDSHSFSYRAQRTLCRLVFVVIPVNRSVNRVHAEAFVGANSRYEVNAPATWGVCLAVLKRLLNRPAPAPTIRADGNKPMVCRKLAHCFHQGLGLRADYLNVIHSVSFRAIRRALFSPWPSLRSSLTRFWIRAVVIRTAWRKASVMLSLYSAWWPGSRKPSSPCGYTVRTTSPPRTQLLSQRTLRRILPLRCGGGISPALRLRQYSFSPSVILLPFVKSVSSSNRRNNFIRRDLSDPKNERLAHTCIGRNSLFLQGLTRFKQTCERAGSQLFGSDVHFIPCLPI